MKIRLESMIARAAILTAATLAMTFLNGTLARAQSKQIETQVDGAVRQLCSVESASKHPRKIVFDEYITTDDFLIHDAIRLVMLYEPEPPQPSGRGKMTAKISVLREDGTREKFKSIQAVQNRADGETQAQRVIDVPLSTGDILTWRFKFQKFKKVKEDQCFLLGGGMLRPPEDCGPYADHKTSDYVLPYRPGKTTVISQSNCGTGSHQGAAKHSYDFAMPIGTEIVASRAGSVVFVEDEHPDGTGLGQHDNVLYLDHGDGTFTRYVHLTQNGGRVAAGDTVEQGQVIALSGNSGSTSGLPHLHFQAQTCPDRNVCGTLPVTFHNTKAHPKGLELGQAYKAKSQ